MDDQSCFPESDLGCLSESYGHGQSNKHPQGNAEDSRRSLSLEPASAMITPEGFCHSDGVRARVQGYLSQLLEKLRAPARPGGGGGGTAREIAHAVFGVLTSREFCYLSKSRVAVYYEATVARLRRDIEQGRPLQFYYDIGGGCHASLDPQGRRGLGFDVGLGELCILCQIAAFHGRVLEYYAEGVEFHLVIDSRWLPRPIECVTLALRIAC